MQKKLHQGEFHLTQQAQNCLSHGQANDEILEYDLSTGFNLSTATFNGAFDGSYADNPTDIIFNNDGSKAFLARASSNGIQSFSLSSPYSFVDITGEYTGDVIDTTSSSNKDLMLTLVLL